MKNKGNFTIKKMLNFSTFWWKIFWIERNRTIFKQKNEKMNFFFVSTNVFKWNNKKICGRKNIKIFQNKKLRICILKWKICHFSYKILKIIKIIWAYHISLACWISRSERWTFADYSFIDKLGELTLLSNSPNALFRSIYENWGSTCISIPFQRRDIFSKI